MLFWSVSSIYIQIYVNVAQSNSNYGFTITKIEREVEREKGGVYNTVKEI